MLSVACFIIYCKFILGSTTEILLSLHCHFGDYLEHLVWLVAMAKLADELNAYFDSYSISCRCLFSFDDLGWLTFQRFIMKAVGWSTYVWCDSLVIFKIPQRSRVYMHFYATIEQFGSDQRKNENLSKLTRFFTIHLFVSKTNFITITIHTYDDVRFSPGLIQCRFTVHICWRLLGWNCDSLNCCKYSHSNTCGVLVSFPL